MFWRTRALLVRVPFWTTILAIFVLLTATISARAELLLYPPALDAGLLPTPHTVAYGEETWTVTENPITIVISESADADIRTIADTFADRVSEIAGAENGSIRIVQSPSTETGITFFLGMTGKLAPDLTTKDGSPFPAQYDGREGYVIRTVPELKWVVCAGSDSRGLRYGVSTLLQLFRQSEDGTVSFKPARITDWPDYPGRAASAVSWRNPLEADQMEEAIETAGFLEDCRFNTLAIPYLLRQDTDWRDPPADFRTYVAEVTSKAVRRDMDLLLLVNPYASFISEASPGASFAVSSSTDLQKLETFCRSTLSNYVQNPTNPNTGRVHLMLCMDQFLAGPFPPWSLQSQPDRRAFAGIPEAAAVLASEMRTRLSDTFPGLEISWCPPWFSTLLMDRMRPNDTDIGQAAQLLPEKIPWVWTGPDIRSREVTDHDVNSWEERTGRQSMVYWDNTFADRWKEGRRIGSFYLADQRETRLPEGFSKTAGMYYLNNGFYGEVARIGLMDVGNFLWNQKDYDPETSLRMCVERVAGPGTVEALFDYRDAYAKAFEVVTQFVNRGEELDDGARDQIAETIPGMQDALGRLEKISPNKRLVEELREKMRRLRSLTGTR